MDPKREDPAMNEPIIIEIYERKLALPKQRYRWRVKRQAPATNYRNLANGGEGYESTAGLIHTLHVLWPGQASEHVLVALLGQPPTPLYNLPDTK